jgi:hypothetical protein
VPYSNGHVPNDAETQPRNRPSAAPPGGRSQGVSSQRNTTASTAEGPSPTGATPYPRIYARSVLFANSLVFTPLSAHATRPTTLWFDVRLSLMGSTFTLVWFVLVQILLYSSTDTCRQSSPHLWWLTFGVLSVMYVMILEVVLVAILVFVVGPILFVRLITDFLLVLADSYAAILEYPAALSRPPPITKPTSFHTRHRTSPAGCRRQTPASDLHPSSTRSTIKTGDDSIRLAHIPTQVPFLAPPLFLAVSTTGSIRQQYSKGWHR